MPRGRKKKFKVNFSLKPETTRTLLALGLILFALLSLLSFFVPNYALNAQVQHLLKGYFGGAAIFLPFLIGIFGLLFIPSLKMKIKEPRVVAGLTMLLLGLASLLHVFTPASSAYTLAEKGMGGGMVGYSISSMLTGAISIYGAVIVLFIVLFIAVFLLFDMSFEQIAEFFSKVTANIDLSKFNFLKKDKGAVLNDTDDISITSGMSTSYDSTSPPATSTFSSAKEDSGANFEVIPSPSEPQFSSNMPRIDNTVSTLAPSGSIAPLEFMRLPPDKIWQEPPLDLLIEPPVEVHDTSEAEKKSKIIKDSLRSFGIDVEIMVPPLVGSSVTQYSLLTKSVTKVSKIASLHEDLAMALASPTGSVRIEAPIPGKPYIGIEVPNANRTMVYFKSIMTSDAMKNIKSKLAIGLGKDVGGKTCVYDITRMPHMLIAGATNSGKSVFIHNILFSILFRASPQEVRLILVDPKRIELSYYQDIPHLLTPVVTDMDRAPSVFRWLVDEMTKRYKLFEQAKVRNIESYNEKSGIQVMPYIVLVVDELAEIMIQDPAGVEKSIIRLAQLSRATGIHLILAVQRPSTNVITGLIKANIPTRAAFNVPSQIDSRVILDQPGAEKLLGKGDMLFVPPDVQKPVRLQVANITDKEINNLVNYLKSQGMPTDYRDDILQMPANKGTKGANGSATWGEDVDELFDQAVEIISTAGKASASLLQRKLSIGYARAARIIDEMEEKGIIGHSMGGSKTRDILLGGSGGGYNQGISTEEDFPVDSLE